MKFKENKKGSGNGPKNLKLKGASKSRERFRKVKKSKATSKPEYAANTDHNTARKTKVEKVITKRGKSNSENIKFKEKPKQNEPKRKKSENSGLPGSRRKRKSEDDSGQVKKKLRVKEEDGVQTRLDRKELKVARRKRKQNYELTVSLIKKYDGLRR